MASNLDKYKADLTRLIKTGATLEFSMMRECDEDGGFNRAIREELGDQKAEEFFGTLVNVKDSYQDWYSESRSVIRQLLPDRLSDFVKYYERPRGRKVATVDTYTIEDYLHGMIVTNSLGNVVVGLDTAISLLKQQRQILKSVDKRFLSSLFDIKTLVQADLFDSELDAARELLKSKFGRAAGAMAGVVIERHLAQVLENNSQRVGKKNPSISDLNDKLKAEGLIDTPQWRYIQHLADIRNLCDLIKQMEPTGDQVKDLLDGVAKITKTIM